MTEETVNSGGSGASRQLKETPRERIIREDTENRKGQSGYIIYEDEIQRVVRLVRKFNLVGWFPFFDLIRSRPHPAPAPANNPSKKRRDAWKWTTCKGCKLKKQCDSLFPYLPPCGRDYDEELALEHDAAITRAEREKVLDELIEHYEFVIKEGNGVTFNHQIDYQWMYGGVVDYLKSLRGEQGGGSR